MGPDTRSLPDNTPLCLWIPRGTIVPDDSEGAGCDLAWCTKQVRPRFANGIPQGHGLVHAILQGVTVEAGSAGPATARSRIR